MVQVRPLIGDVAPIALRWWDELMNEVMQRYQTWLQSDPIERLRVPAPQQSLYNFNATRQRLELRVSTMLLAAMPPSLKEEVVASRQLTAGEIMYKVLRHFQPGGIAEKAETLQSLTVLQSVKTAKDAVESLRRWRRRQLRAVELHAALPDPSLMVKGLTTLCADILMSAPQASFRLSTFRLQQRLDINPTTESLDAYYNMLLAEMEHLTLSPETTTQTAGIKAMNVTKPPLNKGAMKGDGKTEKGGICKNWGTENGCKYGKACRYFHPQLDDQRDRCWICSSVQHRKNDCPHKSMNSEMGQNPKGQGKTNGQMDRRGPGDGRGKKGSKGSSASDNNKGGGEQDCTKEEDKGKGSNTTTTPPADKQGGDTKGDSGKDQGGQVPGETGSTQALVTEMTSLLRSMRMGTPQVSAIRVKRLAGSNPKTTLLDGGATHCLRPMHDEGEWAASRECTVALASGSTSLRMVPKSQVLITRDKETQRIIPIRELVRMGIRINWEQDKITMTRTDGKKLPVWLDEGCPVVDDAVGVELMKEIERRNKQTAGMMKIHIEGNTQHGAQLCGEELANTALEVAKLFPHVPPRLAAKIPGVDRKELDMTKVPFNRRQRKRLMEATTRVLHVFSGEHTRTWMEMAGNGLAVVCIEIEKGTNFLDDNLYSFLLDMARDGLWDLITAGPPCRSVSVQRFRGDGGPRPLRSREGVQRWGLSWNTTKQQEKCDQDSLLLLRTLFLIYTGWVGNPRMETLVEQPSDPEIWIDHHRPRPDLGFTSFLCWPEVQTLMDLMQLREIHFDQGAVGHEHVKPTTLLSNSEEANELIALRADRRHAATWSTELQERLEESKKAAKWAPGIVDVVKRIIMRKKRESVLGPRQGQIRRNPGMYDEFFNRQREARERLGLPPLPDERLAIRALDAKQMDEWKQHIANEHLPARRDCSECLRAMGRDRPHSRNKHPMAYCLNLDIAGPFCHGQDQQETAPRYFLIGVYSVPTKNKIPLITGLQSVGKLEETSDAIPVPEQHQQQDREGVQIPTMLPGEDSQELQEGINMEDIFKEVSEKEKDTPNMDDVQETQIRELDVQNQQWKEDIQDYMDYEIQNLKLAVPLRSRHVTEVIKATGALYCRLRSLACPIHRVHTDRAKEFCSRQFRHWLSQRDAQHTTTAGDEHQGCARVEGEINYLKNRVRLLLTSTRSGSHLWPLALRHASECRFRAQLRLLGVSTPSILTFGVTAMSRVKRWHSDKLQFPMQKVTLYGPASDMSLTSHGYYINCDGKWMRSTVVIVPKFSPDQVQQPELELPQPEEQLADEELFIAPSEEFNLLDVEETEEGKILHHPVQVQELPEGPRKLTHRLHGKQTVPPALAVLRLGGEWMVMNNEKNMQGVQQTGQGGEVLQTDHGGEEPKTEHGGDQQKDINAWTDLALLQLRNLREVEQEERAMMMCEEDAHMALQCRRQCDELEHRLCALQAEEVAQTKEMIEETLVTRTIPVEEVRKDLDNWKEAIQAEYDSLMNHKAIRALSEEEFKEIQCNKETVNVIPGRLVTVVKPPQKRKARIVACGNFLDEQHDKQEVSAGGLDTVVLRSIISLASERGWTLGTADVRTAFLQAPRRESNQKATVIVPPSIVRAAGVLRHGYNERWLVCKALYGLVESPKDWAVFRDQQLKGMSWESTATGQKLRLRLTPEPHLWKVTAMDSEVAVAYLGIYVDDIVVVSEDATMKEVMNQLQQVFQMSPFEQVSESKPISFCGYEIYKDDNGYSLRQEKYAKELLNRRNIHGGEKHPLPKIVEGENEENPDPMVIKEVQAIVGELNWLATRTRPDLSYSTSFVARLVHRRPEYALKLCHHILRYVASFPTLGLTYHKDNDMKKLYVRADTSFGPPHEQFRSVQGVAVYLGEHLLLWTSSRQPFVTLSTAESE